MGRNHQQAPGDVPRRGAGRAERRIRRREAEEKKADGVCVIRLFCLTMTPARHFAGLRLSPLQQVYQGLRRVQHMPVLSET
ncbi:hypothetical protein FA566_01905 [Pseudomonas aeruginosa]|nr:hypothetical protein [Pseudomonas aeruginosa]